MVPMLVTKANKSNLSFILKLCLIVKDEQKDVLKSQKKFELYSVY